MSDEKLIEAYVREALIELKMADNAFTKFIADRLEKFKKSLSIKLASQFDKLLPEKIRQGMSSHATSDVSNFVAEWISDVEEHIDKRLEREKKKEIVDFSTVTFAKYMRKFEDEKEARLALKQALESKYGSLRYH
jgi:hypothetical protein